MNYAPWSNVIYIGQGYLFSHVVSTKLVIVIDFCHCIALFKTIR